MRFPEGSVRIGREESNQLVFAESRHLMVSRRHAEISWEQGSWVLTDLGSTTGTTLNGRATSRAVLSAGDRIGIGEEGPELLVEFAESEIGSTMLVSREERPPSPILVSPLPAGGGCKETSVIPAEELPGSAEAPGRAIPPAQENPPQPWRSEKTPGSGFPSEIPPAPPWPSAASGSLAIPDGSGPPMGGPRIWGLAPRLFSLALAAALLVLAFHSLYLSVQVSRLSGQLKAQTEKVNRLEEATGQLLQKLNSLNVNVNPADMEALFKKKSEELDRRLERKSRDAEEKINMLLDANPLAKWRWERMQKNRR